MISRSCEPVAGLRLSCAIEESIDKHYGAYVTCEHALNRGDLTLFAITFCQTVVAVVVEESGFGRSKIKQLLKALAEKGRVAVLGNDRGAKCQV